MHSPVLDAKPSRHPRESFSGCGAAAVPHWSLLRNLLRLSGDACRRHMYLWRNLLNLRDLVVRLELIPGRRAVWHSAKPRTQLTSADSGGLKSA